MSRRFIALAGVALVLGMVLARAAEAADGLTQTPASATTIAPAAATSAGPPSPQQNLQNSITGDSLANVIGHILDTSKQQAYTVAAALVKIVSPGWFKGSLFYDITLLMLTWFGLNIAINKGDFMDVIPEFIKFVMIWGFTAWFLRDYAMITGWIDSGFDYINNAILALAGPSPGTVSTATTPIGQAWETFMNALGRVVAGVWQSAGSASGSGGGISAIVAFLENMGQYLLAYLAILVIEVFLLIALVIYIGVYFISQAMMLVGIAIGPLMIVWLIFPPLAYLFDGWLGYMITAGLYKVVGTICFLLVANILTNMVVAITAPNQPGGTFVDMSVVGIALLMSVLVIGLMLTVPTIVSHLMSGRGQVGSNLFKAFSQMGSAAARGGTAGAGAGSEAGQNAGGGAPAGGGAGGNAPQGAGEGAGEGARAGATVTRVTAAGAQAGGGAGKDSAANISAGFEKGSTGEGGDGGRAGDAARDGANQGTATVRVAADSGAQAAKEIDKAFKR